MGLTSCVPPLGGRVNVVLSDPVIVTCVAFAAVTVKVEEFPMTIEVGFAVMVTDGAGFAVTVTIALAVV